ncbi:flagellin lysine-N-methylase [Selenomonas ruminantium]|uniref:Lysine-N-methylase n=1 Tax=Selenomonas ruminantium TaxID=971 RepID=A0A1H0VBH4_SELRU|nr:flagellin lysine-N-methylase [Selenomonas ruminantium]SDP75909.1 lysine-N-methylase [Selenomonas ruminantium]
MGAQAEFTCIEPSYLEKFFCDGSKCGSLCCYGWQQILDEEALFRYRSLPGAEGERLRAGLIYLEEAEGFGFLHKDDHCVFLREDGLCGLQKKYGAGMLTDVCAEYPRKTRLFPHHMVERALCVTCPVAAGLIMDSPEPLTLVQRQLRSDRQDYFLPSGDADVLAQLKFFDWQIKGIEILQDRQHTLSERLQELLRVLTKADEELPWGRDMDGIIWQEWDWAKKYQFFREFVTGIEDNTGQTADYLQRAQALAIDGSAASLESQELWQDYSYMLENYLVNEWFKELYPCAVLGTFAYNGMYFVVQWEIWQFLLRIVLLNNEENKTVPQLIRETAQWLASRLNHYTAAREVLMKLLRA